jgi:phosphonate transport system substrate-binding protein
MNRYWRRTGIVAFGLLGLGLLGLASITLRPARPDAPLLDPSEKIEFPQADTAPSGQLRFAVATMLSPESTFTQYQQLVDAIGQRVGLESAFCIRSSYREVRESLLTGQVDLALVCTGTYATIGADKRVSLLVRPEFVPTLSYHCAFVVPHDGAESLEDLRGRRFAFTDQESNTGCVLPRHQLRLKGHVPEDYFADILYTGSHDRSILAVSRRLVDGAAVSSLVLDGMLSRQADLAKKLRVIWRSESYGAPPVLISNTVPAELQTALRKAFLHLHQDPAGQQILSSLSILRFGLPQAGEYNRAFGIFDAETSTAGPRH